MDATQARIQTLEAQVNAMAQAWLYLAANVEIQTGIDMEDMESALRTRRWPGNPAINAEGRDTLRWLCNKLAGARAVRQMRQSKRDH
ncbi:hypothetical protein HF908_11165 [Ralstonia pseudosolanacearum]|uniref:hypothetical protein n=1 Tax=Ralstonia pseudosolanacearum TaxID=1310165 RepID=UPI0018665E94|nr:hypothetical protein [Ralstonia pseudosolanacearum]QOK91987.1 hypothetical protein HF908_11165 [Ralstonia pseudosolanacearum]